MVSGTAIGWKEHFKENLGMWVNLLIMKWQFDSPDSCWSDCLRSRSHYASNPPCKIREGWRVRHGQGGTEQRGDRVG